MVISPSRSSTVRYVALLSIAALLAFRKLLNDFVVLDINAGGEAKAIHGLAVRGSQKFSSTPASNIVHRIYHDTFAHLHCPKHKELKHCLAKLYEKLQSKHKTAFHDDDDDDDHVDHGDHDNTNKSSTVDAQHQHWWFQSLIRDAGTLGGTFVGLDGPWHVGQATDPNVSMCMIEKIGIKHWYTLFTGLNGNINGNPQDTPQRRSDTKRLIPLPAGAEGYPSFVVLRDPLERFLSAYLDKCVKVYNRVRERHCEPNVVFKDHAPRNITANPLTVGYSFGGDDDQLKDRDMGSQRKTAFAMYVDTMPLKWNLHFFPQSLYCNGLYRFLEDYDFVAFMGPKFYNDLDRLGKRYGGRFETQLKEVFQYPSKMTTDGTGEKGANHGVETKASEKMLQYYTPRSLRQVLEYVAIDYELLNLTVPEWAEQMLLEDEGLTRDK